MMRLFNQQRGAMFGLDARITLVVATIIGLVIGINQLARIDSHKVEDTQYRLTQIQAAALRYYEDTGTAPASTATLTAPDAFGQDYLLADYSTDAWGQAFIFLQQTGCGSHVEGQQLGRSSRDIIVISPGADGILNHDYVTDYDAVACDSLPSNMEALIAGDDLMVKINTYNADQRRFTRATAQLNEIRAKIEAQAAHNRIRWQRSCEASGVGLSGCDYNADGTYIQGEELAMNFYPEATEVVAGCAVSRPFYADSASFAVTYTSGDAASMALLMKSLGLPESYAHFGTALLQYDSNDGNLCAGPFNFKLWYN